MIRFSMRLLHSSDVEYLSVALHLCLFTSFPRVRHCPCLDIFDLAVEVSTDSEICGADVAYLYYVWVGFAQGCCGSTSVKLLASLTTLELYVSSPDLGCGSESSGVGESVQSEEHDTYRCFVCDLADSLGPDDGMGLVLFVQLEP